MSARVKTCLQWGTRLKLENSILRCAYVVDRSLRQCFPDDFDARCMYAAFGIWRLTKRMGHEAKITAGDFAALSIAVDNSQAAFQGYEKSEDAYGHYWCEVDGHLVDLGPFYLWKKSGFPAVRAPVVMWPISKDLPPSLQYTPQIRYHPDVIPMLSPEVMIRLEKFFTTCDRKFSSLRGQPKLKGWILTGPESIEVAAANGNLWALGTKRLRDRGL